MHMKNMATDFYNNKFFVILFSILTFGSVAFGQTGPAGVGNIDGSNGQPKLEMWFDAADLGLVNDDLISNWADKSGNGIIISQTGSSRPTYKDASDANYSFSSVRFDGTDDFIPFDGSVLVNTNYTVIAVAARRSNGRNAIMGGSTGTTNQNFHPYFNTNALHSHHWGNDHNAPYTGGAGSTVNATTPDFGVFSFRLDANLASAQRAMFQNGSQIGSRNNNAQLSSYTGSAFGLIDAISDYSTLDLAEIIIFSDALSDAEIIIVNNYLASKYGFAMDNNDYYAGDTPGNGNYDFNVTGIGQFNSAQLTVASSEGFVLESDASLDTDGEFILFGSDNTTNAISTANLGTGVQARWSKTWYLDKTSGGSLGAKISFDIQEGISGDFPAGDKDNYVLLRENAGTYDIVAIADADKAILGSSIEFTVSDADLTDGVYTLGTTNSTDSPLDGQPNQTWYSYKTGNWSDPLTWTTDGSGSDRIPSGGGIPDATDNVVILSGRDITLAVDDIVVSSLEVNGLLDIGATSGHNFVDISGNGIVRLSGSGGVGNFPAGNTSNFADNFIGGTVEYYGSGLTVSDNRLFNNVNIILDNPTDELVLLADLDINGDFTVSSGVFKINDNSSTSIRNLNVQGDTFVDANGSITVGQGNTIGSFSIPGTMPAAGNYHGIYHQITFFGDFTNQGTVRFTNQSAPVYNQFTSTGAATVIFKGATNNIASLFGTTDFYNLIIDKGTDNTYELEINSDDLANFGLYGPNNAGRVSNNGFTAENPEVRKALWIYNGTLHLSGSLEIPTLSEGNVAGGNGDYPIGQNGGLWIDGANVSVYTTADNLSQVPASASGINTGGGNQALSLYGRFRISDGYFGTRASAGFIFWNASAGEVIIEGGTVNVSQFRSAGGGTGTYTYTQSGGDVLVRANEGVPGETSGTYDLFSLDLPDAVFNMSGGTLTVYGNRSNAIFINSAEGNYSVTGGTIRVENRNGNIATIATTVPFWNLEVARDQAGDASEIDLITRTSGTNTIVNPDLTILNNFTIESGITFDHNGNDVTIGSDFTIEAGGDYVYAGGKRNTTSFIGTDNATLTFLNRTGGTGDEQRFWNFVVDRPAGKTLSFESGKTNRNGNNNNLLRVDGDFFKVLSGTVDQGTHSIRMYADTLVNYDELTVFDPSVTADSDANGENDLLKLRDDGGAATIFITADTSRFGGIKLNSADEIIELVSDVKIDYLEYRHGRIDIGTNNLTIDVLNEVLTGEANGPNGSSQFSVEDMFITAGNASDGGLSLKVNADGTNPGFIDSDEANSGSNPTVFLFPVGTGNTGDNATSEYTPVNIRLASASDEGYITVIPVTKKLATAGPYPLGNDIADRYWIVDYKNFSSVPKVERIWFRAVEKDDPNGGADGFPGNYVPGYVLEDTPFTRTAEVEAGAPGSSGIDNASADNIRIFFWGNEGSGNPAGGFDLINAAYTAGDPSKFVGAPQVFYNTNTGRRNWNNGNKWTTNTDGTDDGVNDYPQAGDIALLYNYGSENQNSWVNANIDISVARVEFSNSGGGWLPRLWVTKNDAVLDLGPVSGTGSIYLEITSASQPTFSSLTDINDFSRQTDSNFTWKIDNNSTVNLPSQFEEYPTFRIEAGGGSDNNRILQTSVPITINGWVRMDRGPRFRMNHDVTIKEDLRITWQENNSTTVELGDDRAVTLTVEGDLRLEDGNGNGPANLVVKNDNQNGYVHRIRVGGNIVMEDFNESQSSFDLYNGAAPNNNAILEFINSGNNTFTNASSLVPEFYRIEMNKGASVANSMQIDSDFDLMGPTSGVGVDKALEIINGTLILNNANIDVDLTTGDDDYNISATGGLQITQGTANVSGDDSGIRLDGSLTIDGGTLNMDDAVGNGNNYIEYSASGNAQLNVSGGFLTVGSQIRRNLITTEGKLSYSQTGGTVVVGKNVTPEASRGVFEISNLGSSFTYTGGTLTLVRQNTASPSVAALRILPTSSNVTQPIYIGNGDTPTNQSNFGINANVPLAGIVVNGTNNPTAVIQVNTLELDGDLIINSGASFDANGIDLILNADLNNDGTFIPSSNNTIFGSTTTQTIAGSGTTTFYDFEKNELGTLEINDNDVTVNNLFSFTDGLINDNGFTIDIKGNAVIDGEHNSNLGFGNGIQFSGTSQQQLQRSSSGTSSLGIVTIANTAGIVIPEGGGYDFDINGELKMNGGVFNIGSSSVTLGQNAEVTTTGTFSVTNMVKTNSSFSDNGLTKIFNAGYNQTFTFPIGEVLYTPVIADMSVAGGTTGSSVGSISAKPANEYHPTIDDGNDVLAGGDINNVLQYYWTIKSTGLTGFKGDIQLFYDQSLVSVADGGYSEADYIAARILNFNNPTNDINKYSSDDLVDEGANEVNFNNTVVFDAVNSNSIAGDYFAGLDLAIPDNVATYTSTGLGGLVTDDATYVESLPTPGTAPSGAVLVVSNGTEVNFNVNSVRLYKTIIEDGGVLNVDNTDGHRLGILEGTGTLKITSNTSSAPLPAADYGDFFSCSGGGLEYAGTGSYNVLPGISSLRNLTLSGSGDRNFPNNNVTVCEDFIVDGPETTILANKFLEIQGDLIVNDGNIYVSSGNTTRLRVFDNVQLLGGSLNSASGTNSASDLRGNVNINGGVLNLNGTRTFVKGDFNFISGNILSGNSTLILNSNTSIQTISGEITGSNSLNILTIDNRNGTQDFMLDGNIEIITRLDLNDGKLLVNQQDSVILGASATVSPAAGRSNSYITGKVTKVINSAGGNFTFPIGDANYWRPAKVRNVSTGGLTWEAQFWGRDVVTNTTCSNMNPTSGDIATLQQGEYWIVSDGAAAPSGVTANVGLSWGTETDVSSNSLDRQELEVMAWNSGSSSWDNYGGGSFSGGNSKDQGSFESTSAVTFSENIFVVGSGDAANPLPVEMVRFDAELSNGYVYLEWETASEKDNDFFEIQRSYNGDDYESIGLVEGNGTTLTNVVYDFTDYSPLSGKSYYRLKQVDYDGDYEYSKIVTIEINKVSSLNVVPNPTTERQIYLKLDGFHPEQTISVNVFNLQGASMFRGQFSPDELWNRPLPVNTSLKSGIYIVEVVQGNTQKQVRLAIR
jgi:hypothetical protein